MSNLQGVPASCTLWCVMRWLAELGAWWEAARLAPEMLSAAWKVSAAALCCVSVASWLQKRQELMRRAHFPTCGILPHGQPAWCVGGLRRRSAITSSPNKGRERG